LCHIISDEVNVVFWLGTWHVTKNWWPRGAACAHIAQRNILIVIAAHPLKHKQTNLPVKMILKYAICGHIMFRPVMLMLGLRCDSEHVTADYPTPLVFPPTTMLQSWAQYSPYYSAAEYKMPPPGCTVAQVSLHPFPTLKF